MAWQVAEEKAYYLGTWKDDAVTDQIIKEITTISNIEKGRKMKLKVTSEGFEITKSRLFQSKVLFDYIPLRDIFFMTTNQYQPTCLLCIVKDPKHKYMIVAFRMASPVTVGHFVSTFRSIKRAAGSKDNVEFRKKDDGNWTLRERSNANAKRELQQLFDNKNSSDETMAPQHNGGIFYKKSEKRNGISKRQNIYDETPYEPSSATTTTTTTYTSQDYTEPVSREDLDVGGRQIHNVGTQAVHDDDNESIISDVSSMRSEIDAMSAELSELKYLLEKSTGMSVQEHYRRAAVSKGDNNNVTHAINYNTEIGTRHVEPRVIVQNGHAVTDGGQVRVDVPDYRSYGSQTAPKMRSRSLKVNGPQHLMATSYRRSINQQVVDDVDGRTSEIDKFRHRVHSVHKQDSIKSTGTEIQVPKHGEIVDPADGYIYSAERDAEISTVAYPSSTIASGKRQSISSVVMRGQPQMYTTRRHTGTFSSSGYRMVPRVVERPIERIYSRPVIIRREYVGRGRPHSTYVVKSPTEDTYVYGSQILSKEAF